MKEIVSYIVSELKDFYHIEEAQELAYWIVEETTGITRTQIYMGYPREIIPNLQHILEQLKQHTPIQYVFGHTQWMGLDLHVNSSTLIPRPETAELVDWITSSCDNNAPLQVLDIGTGSGCIAVAIKQKCPNWQVKGVDISDEALTIAKENGTRNNVQVTWQQMDILLETPDFIDIIVSNPPYICHKEKAQMDERVLAHEPHTALFVPDDDPLLFYRRIAVMKSAKSVYFEINEAYGEEVCEMMKSFGYSDVTLKYDIYGKPRMVFGRIEA